MTDTQILTIVIAVVFPTVAVIYSQLASKDRFGDMTKNMTDRFGDMNRRFSEMDARFDVMEKRLIAHIDNAFQHMEMMLKLHEAEHHKK